MLYEEVKQTTNHHPLVGQQIRGGSFGFPDKPGEHVEDLGKIKWRVKKFLWARRGSTVLIGFSGITAVDLFEPSVILAGLETMKANLHRMSFKNRDEHERAQLKLEELIRQYRSIS